MSDSAVGGTNTSSENNANHPDSYSVNGINVPYNEYQKSKEEN